jgi:hypothetical protein
MLSAFAVEEQFVDCYGNEGEQNRRPGHNRRQKPEAFLKAIPKIPDFNTHCSPLPDLSPQWVHAHAPKMGLPEIPII